jgi:hypothetical protein
MVNMAGSVASIFVVAFALKHVMRTVVIVLFVSGR